MSCIQLPSSVTVIWAAAEGVCAAKLWKYCWVFVPELDQESRKSPWICVFVGSGVNVVFSWGGTRVAAETFIIIIIIIHHITSSQQSRIEQSSLHSYHAHLSGDDLTLALSQLVIWLAGHLGHRQVCGQSPELIDYRQDCLATIICQPTAHRPLLYCLWMARTWPQILPCDEGKGLKVVAEIHMLESKSYWSAGCDTMEVRLHRDCVCQMSTQKPDLSLSCCDTENPHMHREPRCSLHSKYSVLFDTWICECACVCETLFSLVEILLNCDGSFSFSALREEAITENPFALNIWGLWWHTRNQKHAEFFIHFYSILQILSFFTPLTLCTSTRCFPSHL